MCQSVSLAVRLYNSSQVFKNSYCICQLVYVRLAQFVYVSFEFRGRVKMSIKMFRNFPKKSGGGIGFRIWVKRINSQHLLILLNLCVVWCGSVKHSFSVCSVISSFSCLAVNNCIGNMLDFPEFWHLARSFVNQSDCRTFQTSILKKQAILNMYLDIIEGLDILGTNESIKRLCLVMVNSGMSPNFVLTNQIPRSLKLQ